MRELTVECGNEICNCTAIAAVGGSDVYCSDFCQDATEQSVESPSCSCGHPPCDEP